MLTNPAFIRSPSFVPPAAGGGFTPLSLSPFLWIDPSDLTTLFQSNAGTTAVTTDGDVVGFASDKSGGGFHLNSNADDTTRPTYKNVSSIQYIDFDGSNDAIKRLADAGLFNTGGFSCFMAVKANSVATGKTMISEGGSSSSNTVCDWIRSDATTATLAASFVRNTAGTTLLSNNWGSLNSGLDNTWRVIGFTWDGTTLTPFVNGQTTAGRALAGGTAMTTDRLALGCQWRASDGFTVFAPMSLAGLVIVKSVLGTTDKANLITWLGAKVGLVL